MSEVVVTGMGCVTPIGCSIPEFWSALVKGKSGVRRMTYLDAEASSCSVMAEVTAMRDLECMPLCNVDAFAVEASRQALMDARLWAEDRQSDNVGIIVGTSGTSALENLERIKTNRRTLGRNVVVGLWPNSSAHMIASELRIGGACTTICNGCVSSSQAIAFAAERLANGSTESAMLVVGTDSMGSQAVLEAFSSMKVLSRNPKLCPSRSSRPFDAERCGLVPGQGAGAVLLEKKSHAINRGASPLARIAGYGEITDNESWIRPDHTGRAASLAMRRAIYSSGVSPDLIGYVNCSAAGTISGDASEVAALRLTFGDNFPAVSSTKSMIGHTGGASGILSLIVCTLSLCNSRIHPSINIDRVGEDCLGVNVITEAMSFSEDFAISNSFGIGGHYVSLLVAKT